jgi:hypothetical protein
MPRLRPDKKTAAYLAAFSLYASVVALPRWVDIIVYRLLPKADCAITMVDSDRSRANDSSVIITQFGAGAVKASLVSTKAALAEAAKEARGFHLAMVDTNSGKYGWVATEKGSSVTVHVKPQSNFWIKAHVGPNSGAVAIQYKGETRTFDLFSESAQERYLYPALGRFNALNISLRALSYLVLSLAIFLLLLLAYVSLSQIRKTPYRTWPFFLATFVLLVLYCYLRRRNGYSPVPYGDTVYYWNSVRDFGGFNEAWRNPVTFRGYLFPTLVYLLQKLLPGKLDPFNLYAIFSSLTTSLFLTVIVPNLFLALAGRKPAVLSVCLFGVVYLYFWRDYTFYVLTDQFALTTLFAFLLFMAIYLRGDRRRPFLYLFLSGLFLGGTVNFHTGYTFGLLATVLVFIAGAILNFFKKDKILVGAQEEVRQTVLRVNSRGLAVLVCGILIVSLPQIFLNIERLRNTSFGRLTPFPYDYRGVWEGSRDQTLSEYVVFLSLQYATQGHPYGLSDRPGENILASTYPSVDGFKAGFTDFANIVAARPWDYLSIMANKLFLMLDTKLSEEYPTDRELGPFEWLMFNSISGTNLFSLLNYCVIAMALSFLCTKRLRATLTRAEIATFLGVFVLIGLPRLVAHVEWRYFMAIYASLYYVVAYSVAGNLEAFRELPSRMVTKYVLAAFGVVNLFYFLSRIYYPSLAWG